MRHSILVRQRLLGIFLFDRAAEWGGIPVSYLYLFGVWLLIIVLAALTVEADRR